MTKPPWRGHELHTAKLIPRKNPKKCARDVENGAVYTPFVPYLVTLISVRHLIQADFPCFRLRILFFEELIKRVVQRHG